MFATIAREVGRILDQYIDILLPVAVGIFMCKTIYNTASTISSSFKFYIRLESQEKVEWSNRCFSSAHAVFVAGASFYLLLFAGLFSRDSPDEYIINRRSTLSDSVLGVSVGYFLTDIAMMLHYFPDLGGAEYLLHHGLSMYSICLSIISGQAQFYILLVLFSEVTSPFVNLRWHLDVAGLKDTALYVANGIALFLGWLVARVLLFILFFVHMYHHFDEVQMVFPLGFYSLLIVPPALATMNLFWFWKICRGLFKALSKSKHRH